MAAAGLWGTLGTAAALAVHAGPLALAAASIGLGGLALAAAAAKPIRAAKAILLANRWDVIVGGLAMAVHPVAFYAGMDLTGVAVGTVVAIGSAPACAAAMERVSDGVHLPRRSVVAIAIGLVGVSLLAFGRGAGASGQGGAMAAGIGLGLVAGATYAAYSWAVRRLIRKGVAPRAATGACMGSGGLALMPLLALTGSSVVASPTDLGVALFMAAVPIFAAYALYGAGLARVTAATATTLALFEPMVATVLALALLHERLDPAAWIGLALVALCLITTTLPSPPRTSRWLA